MKPTQQLNNGTGPSSSSPGPERDHTRAMNAARVSGLQLGYLIGRDGDLGALVPPALLLDVSTTVTDAGSAERVQRRRDDVEASFRRASALRESAKEPPRRFIPSLGVVGQYRLSTEEGFSGRNTDWTVGVNLTWNLWDGGERAADEAERTALALAAELESQALLRRAGLEFKTAVANVESARTAVTQAQAAVEIATRNANESAELYRQGLTTALVVADAGLRLFDAEVTLARERYGLGLAHLDVRSSLGQTPTGNGGAR